MITQSVITAVLIGTVITGVVPLIGGIALLAVHKIKASSFWAGVLTYIIAMIAFSLISLVITLSSLDMSSMSSVLGGSVSPGLQTALQIVMAVCFALSMSICIIFCMKKTRTFAGALSCGLGLAAAHLITAAVSFVSMYINFLNVNSGAFDQQMAALVSMGVYTKEDVKLIREQFTAITTADVFSSITLPVAFALMFAAAAVFIMRGVCAKKAAAGAGAALVLFAVQFGASGLIANAGAAAIIAAAVGAAALIFAVRMRKDIIPPEKPSYANDSFMQSIENVKSEAGAADDK